MITEFTVGNFLSFKESVTLSMVASALREKHTDEEDMSISLGDTPVKLLKSAIIFGANASGKSNLIKGLSFCKDFIVNSAKQVQSSDEINVENFRLSLETADAPSYFELILTIEGAQYRYGFEIDKHKVHREWLYHKNLKKRAKEVELLFRDNGNYELHNKLSVSRELVSKKMIRDNALLLSVAAQFNENIAQGIIEELSNITIITSLTDNSIKERAIAVLNDDAMRSRITRFAQYADFGIDDIVKVDNTLISRHTLYDGDNNELKQVNFDFYSSESEGTIKYFSLAHPIITALDEGKVVVIDEFDAKMHPLLTASIVTLFNSKISNPKGAQLIFTTHDTNLLSSYIFRRDQVWFTEKDRYGASKLFPLSDYNVRNTSPFEKDYLSGRYGAVPIIRDLEQLFTPKNEEVW